MNIDSRIAKIGLATAITLAASTVCAMPVDVSYSVTGSAGDWLLDFTVTNNVSSPAGDDSIYLLALQMQPGEIVGSPGAFFALTDPFDVAPSDGGLTQTYDFGWLDFGLLGFPAAPSIGPSTSLGGFFVHLNSVPRRRSSLRDARSRPQGPGVDHSPSGLIRDPVGSAHRTTYPPLDAKR